MERRSKQEKKIDVPEIGTATVRYSQRRTVALEITGEGSLLIRAPLHCSDRRILLLCEDKRAWLLAHLRHRRAHPSVFSLALSAAQEKQLRQRAKEELPPRVAFWAREMGVSYGKISIRRQKTRWGSCSSQGNLNFNFLLMLYPPELRDYVIIHELCHRKEMNHSKQFYALLAQYCPNYPALRRRLKDGSYLAPEQA